MTETSTHRPVLEGDSGSAHSFVIRIWNDAHGDDDDEPLWRGHITHVPGSEVRYIQDLDAVIQFIASFLRPPIPRLGAGRGGAS